MKWLVTLVLFCSVLRASATELVIGVPQPHLARDMGQAVLTEAYRRLGYTVRFEVLPQERSLYLANRGEIDGDLPRIRRDLASSGYPDLILIDAPVAREDLVAFGRGEVLQVAGLESLKPYRLGITRGMQLFRGHETEYRLSLVNQADAAFRMLDAGRVDLVVLARSGLCFAHSLGLNSIVVQEPPISQSLFYHYLNKRHATLAEKVTNTLRLMEKDGTQKRIEKAVAQQWANCPKSP